MSISPCNYVSIINESYPLSLRLRVSLSLIYSAIYILLEVLGSDQPSEWVTLCHYFLVGDMCLSHCMPGDIMIMLTPSCKCNTKLSTVTVTL